MRTMSEEFVEPSSNTLGQLPPISGATTISGEGRVAGFSVHLENFDGPFDLLLQLISRHRMDITDVAIATVTDEFISYIRELEKTEEGWKLDHATEFLVVAATLLDLKAARLLPSGEIDDEEDLALLEARDLLFARLLQYRAFKEIANILAERISAQEKTFPRSVSLDPVFAALLLEVLIWVTPERFAAIANRYLILVVAALRRHKTMTFRGLVADAPNTLVVVARFLSLLELYKDGSVRFEQLMALGELQITWTGAAEGEIAVSDEFDREPVLESNDESAASQPEQRDN